MSVVGTSEAVSQLRGEGFQLTKSRLEAMLATGRVPPPALVGTSRAWTEADVANVRRALIALDGAPSTRGGAR